MLQCAITDRKLLPQADDAVAAFALLAARWAAAGVDYIQLREKDLPAGELERMARAMTGSIRIVGGKTKLLVNGRVDVAMAAGADGVHLTAQPGEVSMAEVRRLWPQAVVSVSCHSAEDVRHAAAGGADFLLFAPVFEKSLGGAAPLEGVGLARLTEACHAAGKTPVLALGGVTAENAPECIAAGAAGIAAIRLFL